MENFAKLELTKSVANLLQETGFSSTQTLPLNVLTELAERTLVNLSEKFRVGLVHF